MVATETSSGATQSAACFSEWHSTSEILGPDEATTPIFKLIHLFGLT